MKIQINRNILWAKKIVDYFYDCGVRDVCISPGSRNTPMTLAFAANSKIKKHVIIDERSSAFFALGLSKKQKSITAVLTTSGTAVAELYPAIIEAYFEKLPLIILTADRPDYLRNSGANQTINQDNIFQNHIRAFVDLGLPNVTLKSFENLRTKIDNVLSVFSSQNKGPVHFNIQFEKPFEPSKSTDSIEESFLEKIDSFFNCQKLNKNLNPYNSEKTFLKILSGAKKILIISGHQCEETERRYLPLIASNLNAPIFSGILSPLRTSKSKYVIKNASSFLRQEKIKREIEPDLILQFGFTSISNSMLDFIAQTNAIKASINPFNERYDPSLTTKITIKSTAEEFYKFLNKNNFKNTDKHYLQFVKKIDSLSQLLKVEFIQKQDIRFEWKVYKEMLGILSPKTNLMISNSLPIRDLDYIFDEVKNVNIFSNRGASGIDGIISTAAGIFESTKLPTYLIIGDLAFLYDLNALQLLREKNIPLKIISINNNGGGIFELLPIAKEKIEFVKYFKTPINMSFGNIVKSFGGKYFSPKNISEFKRNFKSMALTNKFSVMELKINSKKSSELRKQFWNQLSKYFNS